MFTTLLAQEARSLARTHLIALGICFLVGAGLVGITLLDVPVLSNISTVLAAMAFLAPVMVVFVHCLVEYWQSMSGQRAYLTMVIPVRGRQIYTAKVAYAVLATVVTVLAALPGLLVAYLANAHIQGVGPAQAYEPVAQTLESVGAGHMTLFVGTFLITLLAYLVMYTALMSIGAQGRWNHLGPGAPLIGLVILNLVSQAVTLVAMLFVPFSIDLTTGDLGTRLMLGPFLETLGTDTDPQILGLGFIPVTWLLAAGMGWWAVRAVERHTCLR